MVRLHSTGLSFSSVLCPATRRRRGKVGLEAGAARYNVSNVDRECTQITINLGGSLQLPAEAALLCKDWLAIRAPGCGLRRTESANPAGVILIKCCLCRRMTRTLLPPCVVRRCLVRPITGPPLTVSPFKEPIGTPVVFQSPPPSSIFSSDHR